jgi:hypothetical protein
MKFGFGNNVSTGLSSSVQCRRLILMVFACIAVSIAQAQNGVSVNTTGNAPDPSAMLDIQSDSKGVLIPRLTTDQRDNMNNPAPAIGLLVYDTNYNSFWYYNGLIWVNLRGTGVLEDTDQDTKIQVEESPDEDMIRFDVAGVEVMRHDGKTLHAEAPGGSLFIGTDAGTNDDGIDDGVENENTFIGVGSGYANTVGILNTFLGNNAGAQVDAGSANIFLGHRAGFKVNNASRNTFVGVRSGYNNIRGNDNFFVGYQAGYNNNLPDGNHFAGYQAGFSNTTGFQNQFIGYKAGYSNTTGSENVFMGNRAGYTANQSKSTYIGSRAGDFSTSDLGGSLYIGYKAGQNDQGFQSQFIG